MLIHLKTTRETQKTVKEKGKKKQKEKERKEKQNQKQKPKYVGKK